MEPEELHLPDHARKSSQSHLAPAVRQEALLDQAQVPQEFPRAPVTSLRVCRRRALRGVQGEVVLAEELKAPDDHRQLAAVGLRCVPADEIRSPSLEIRLVFLQGGQEIPADAHEEGGLPIPRHQAAQGLDVPADRKIPGEPQGVPRHLGGDGRVSIAIPAHPGAEAEEGPQDLPFLAKHGLDLRVGPGQLPLQGSVDGGKGLPEGLVKVEMVQAYLVKRKGAHRPDLARLPENHEELLHLPLDLLELRR